MKEICTQVDIDAPPERIWSILTDFSRFPEWNPLVPEASGEGAARLVHGERFTGLLVPLLAKSLDRDALPAFERMNRALKERAETESH